MITVLRHIPPLSPHPTSPVLDSLYEGGGETAGVVPELSPAGRAVQHPGPAALAGDVTGGAAGDGQVSGDQETHRALHYRLKVRQGVTGI